MKIDKISSSLILITIVLLILPGIARAANNSPIVTYFASEGKIVIRNESKWIRIDPVSDHFAGDQFTITGTTNLPVGAMIIGELYTLPPPCHAKNCDISYEKYGIHRGASIDAGLSPDSNVFSIRFNTSNLVSDSFTLHIGSDGFGDYYSSIFLFPVDLRDTILSLRSSPPHSSTNYWIVIDPPSDQTSNFRTVGICFRLNGLTNLPVGENISYTIVDTFAFHKIESKNDVVIDLNRNRGYIIPTEKEGINRFFVDVNASGLNPGYYWVTLWNPRYNTSLSNDFLSASTPVDIHAKISDNLSITCSVNPLLPNTQQLTPATPLSLIGTCAALIGSGMLVMLVWRRVKQG
jgi:hypothetical protein